MRIGALPTPVRAGIREDAASVLLIGLDVDAPEEGFRRVLPVAKAMHPDTLLAYAMNGDVLPPDHGFPLRAVVPGWVGSSSIKWLGRIQVSKEPLWTRNNSTSYVLIGDDFPAEGDRLGPAVTTQTIKSALALSWPAELSQARIGSTAMHSHHTVRSKRLNGAWMTVRPGVKPPRWSRSSSIPGHVSASTSNCGRACTRS